MSRAAVVGRPESAREELANSVSHGVGLVAALACMPLLIAPAARSGSRSALIGVSVFAASAVLLYLGSTLYHALPVGAAKRVLRVLEHGAIYGLIAGTYTPFALGVLRGRLGTALLSVIWTLAALGVLLELSGVRRPRLTLALYVGMGWLVLLVIRPLWLLMPLTGFVWLVAGGLAYTAGLVFYGAKRLRYGHCVWHLFVLAGSACHFMAVRCCAS